MDRVKFLDIGKLLAQSISCSVVITLLVLLLNN